MVYQIKIKGGLDQSWSNWLGDVAIQTEQMDDGSLISTLMGDGIDQATLFGILDRIRDLNLVLVSVNQHELGEASFSASESGRTE